MELKPFINSSDISSCSSENVALFYRKTGLSETRNPRREKNEKPLFWDRSPYCLLV